MGPTDGGVRGQWRAVSSSIRRVPGKSARPVGGWLVSVPQAAAFGSMSDSKALRAFCAVLVLAAAVILAPPAGAGVDANPAASAFMRDLGTESIRELTDPATPRPEREARFRRLLVEHFDMAAISKFVLGRYWRTATESQRLEFRKAHVDFIVHSYSARFGEYRGVGFRVVGSTDGSGGAIVAHSRIRTSKTEEVSVDWRLRAAGDSFVIVDIVVEGISMAVTQRSDFGSIIQNRGGIDGLIAALRAKSAESTGSAPAR